MCNDRIIALIALDMYLYFITIALTITSSLISHCFDHNGSINKITNPINVKAGQRHFVYKMFPFTVFLGILDKIVFLLNFLKMNG